MTVCVALIAESDMRPSIVGVSDALITYGNLISTPPSSKSYNMDGSTAIMFAGNADLHWEICERMLPAIRGPSPLSTPEIAQLYAATYRQIRSQHAAAHVLGNYGLDLPTFLAKKRAIRDDLALHLTEMMDAYRFHEDYDVQVIVTGVDGRDAHLWTVRYGHPANLGGQGFAAIGIGADHALTFLMRAAYDTRWWTSDAMTMGYFAKRRGEWAPSVGSDRTDLFTIGPGPNSFNMRLNDVTDALAERYAEFEKAETDARNLARGAMLEMSNRYAAQNRRL